MGYNKIPLALRYNDTTQNAEGLVEFTLNLSDVGDFCNGEGQPSTGDVLTWDPNGNEGLGCWKASSTPAVAAGNLSSLQDVCEDFRNGDSPPAQYQALIWDGGAWCPSTLPSPGGGGGGYTPPTATSVGEIIISDSLNEFNDTITTTADLRAFLETDAKLSSLTDVVFEELGGENGDLPQHIQWDGTNFVNAYEDEQYFRVKNNTGSTLTTGQAVFVSGAHNQNVGEVGLAQADSESTMPAIGLIYENISTGGEGLAVTFGRVLGLALPDADYDEGDTLYISPDTPGGVTNQKPTGITQLIQNIGIVTKTHDDNGAAKVTGVGRANDIPNTLTLGQTTITSASAKFANVEDYSVMITDGVSAVSSVSGASGSIVYFENDPPRPGLKTFANILSNENYNIEPGKTYVTNPVTGPFTINTTTTDDSLYIETTEDSSVAAPVITLKRTSASVADGDYLGQLKFKGESDDANERVYAKITGKIGNDTDGIEDGLIELMVRNNGANLITTRFTGDALKLINGNGLEVDGTLDVTGAASLSSATVATTPTAATDVANKSYVDSQVTTPSYLQALSSGTLELTDNATEYNLGWSTAGTYAITDPAGNLEVQDGDSQGHNINVSGDGVYQIDCSVQTSNSSGRCGSVLRIYLNTGSGFSELSELRASNYASRGLENIVTGSTNLNTLLSLNAGDKLKFTIMRNAGVGTPDATANGTYVRIVKVG